jgi:paraquat-inducible protein A
MALALAALILFIPANTLPILSMNEFGFQNESTIWAGVVALWSSGTPGIAILVLLCSIVIPFAKIIGLFFVCLSWKKLSPNQNSTFLRFIEIIGRWSMLDVFLVAILVSIVKLGSFASVKPESGLIAFAGVVVLTMISSATFDSQLLWRNQRHS